MYERQSALYLKIPRKITILGLGGTGSWCAYFSALVGVRQIGLVDFDVLEEHNLNRTPYWPSQVGKKKLEAMSELIHTVRLPLKSFCPDLYMFDKSTDELSPIQWELLGGGFIIDCRDIASQIPLKIHIKLGYDGFDTTIWLNPNYKNLRGEIQGMYSTFPSYLCPCVSLANTAINLLCTNNFPKEEKIINRNLNREVIL
ncbi:MAG: ThiF family adenylyltransferase [Candidatus Methanofastidiosia archaeon]|jgi:hypothetical protein